MAHVTFLGACGTVTGSCTLLRWGETRILVDCGLFQGPVELERRNFAPFDFAPEAIDAVLLTHAHLDHSGRLPRLVAQGFGGPIYCSRPTAPLASLVLHDAARLAEEEARYARKKGYSRHRDPQPLFTESQVREALALVQKLDFDVEHEIRPGVRVRLRRAGHLLGAASLEIAAKGSDGKRRSWCFSGDVGRYDVPILKDPEPPLEPPTALFLESTYGDRRHAAGEAKAELAKIIRETFAAGGVVLIPAFALGRTQEILYHLAALSDEGLLDPSQVFLDSPMAIHATELYRQARSEHDEDLAELVAHAMGPFRPDRFARCRTSDESKALNDRRAPAVIVAGSGMATGGRIVHHLAHRLGDARTTVAFVGYQASGTRGRALVEGAQEVVIHGRAVPVRARIVYLAQLSAHADRDELLRWCRALPGPPPERVFLNHGEDHARKALERAIVGLGWPRPDLPVTGDRVDF